jgi:hypothetical protein
MIHWYWALVTLVAGGAVTSFIEYRLKYNLTDEELDVIRGIWAKISGTEKAVLGKISAVKKAV